MVLLSISQLVISPSHTIESIFLLYTNLGDSYTSFFESKTFFGQFFCKNASLRVNPFRGREATAPSVIRKIREVQRREEAPPEGGAITPKDVHMKPFKSKGELNPSLHSRVIDQPRGPDGFPGGHGDFDGGHPGLREDFVNGVAVIEVLTTSLGPKVV